MRDASLIASIVQSGLALYFALVLFRGAVTPARKTLGRMLLGLSGYAASLSFYYALPDGDIGSLAVNVAQTFVCFSLFDFGSFALWLARGGDPAEHTSLGAVVAGCAAVVFMAPVVVVVTIRATTGGAYGVVGQFCQLVMIAALLVATLVAFGLAVRRRRRGALRYIGAAAWLLAPVFANFAFAALGDGFLPVFRLVRDLSVVAFEFTLVTAYLDTGHEPISLRDRIVAATLTTLLSFAIAAADLLLPLAPATPPDVSVFTAHAGATRLVFVLIVAVGVVLLALPLLFRRSVLTPIERLASGLREAESGARVELPVDRQDELGVVARSFNRMVSALGEGRDALADKILQLEHRKGEIEALNEELRRQIALRSRQLADALREIDPAARAIQPGAKVDVYEVEDVLGAGAMGVVFGATRTLDGRRFALKIMRGAAPEEGARFMREAEIAATVHHENLVGVVDVGVHFGAPYLVMDRLDGGSLADASTRFGELAFVVPILGQIAAGLAALHARGVLHRDLKPANVLLDSGAARAPVAKIGDFGIAHMTVANGLESTMDVLGATSNLGDQPPSVAGTYPYMAPELARGPAEYGPASDVFSFGVLAWEVCVGALPWPSPIVLAALEGTPIESPAPPKLAPELASLLAQCISVRPSERPSIAEIRGVLGRVAPARID